MSMLHWDNKVINNVRLIGERVKYEALFYYLNPVSVTLTVSVANLGN